MMEVKGELIMMHPLHTPELLIGKLQDQGEHFDITRGTGRSTAIAFMAIHSAMTNPHMWLRVHDHSNTRAGEELVWNYVKSIVTALKLKHFVYRRDNGSYHIAFGYPNAT